jgi:threonine aldolase
MYPVQVNSVFVQLPADVWHALQQEHFFYDWDFDDNVVRWMCSFDTTEDDIAQFAADMAASF